MLYFLVYNDNTHTNYVYHLIKSVNMYGKDFKVIVFDKKNIDQEFVEKNKSILNCPRGGGYWLWKPYIIHETLKKINENDILFYIDSKYFFIEEFTHLYEDYMKTNDLLVWKNKPNEPIWYMKNWCKMDVIHKYHMYDKVFKENAEDCWAGALIIKKTERTIKYIHEWLTMACIYEDITDTPSNMPNDKLFHEHRHDQSLLSIVLHKYHVPLQFFEKKYLQNVRAPF